MRNLKYWTAVSSLNTGRIKMLCYAILVLSCPVVLPLYGMVVDVAKCFLRQRKIGGGNSFQMNPWGARMDTVEGNGGATEVAWWMLMFCASCASVVAPVGFRTAFGKMSWHVLTEWCWSENLKREAESNVPWTDVLPWPWLRGQNQSDTIDRRW